MLATGQDQMLTMKFPAECHVCNASGVLTEN